MSPLTIYLVLALKIALVLGAAALVSTITFRVIGGGGKWYPDAAIATSKGIAKNLLDFNRRNGEGVSYGMAL